MATSTQPTIPITGGMLLRPFQMSDAPAVLEAFSTPDIQYWHCRSYESISQAEEWIQGAHDRWKAETAANWAVTSAADDAVLGRVAINTNFREGIGEVAYWMLSGSRGAGIAPTSAIAATKWAHELGMHRVILQHSTRNEASGRVAFKSGFTNEGVQRQAGHHADGWHDMQLHSHLSTDHS